MKVLIAAPVTGSKQYSMNQWLVWIANQTHPYYEFALCVNGKRQARLVNLLKKVEITDIHGQKKKPVIIWNQPKKGVVTNILQNITHARESLRKYAYENKFDKLLFLDTDTIPMSTNAIKGLIDTGKQAVSGLYFYKETRVPVAVSTDTGTNFTMAKIEKAVESESLLDTAIFGLGCAMFDKSIFNTLEFDYKNFGKELGDDYGYCYALDQMKVKRWIEPRVVCKHLGDGMKINNLPITRE